MITKISPMSYEEYYYNLEKYGNVIIGEPGLFDRFLSLIFGKDKVCKWFGHWGYSGFNYGIPTDICYRCLKDIK